MTVKTNCICNLDGVNISDLGESRLSSNCFNPGITRTLWWKYKLHKNEFQIGNEPCQHISCKNDSPADKVEDKLCGLLDNDRAEDVDLLHVCRTNSNNNTTSDIGLPWKFSFIYKASVETDSDQIQSKVVECKAIACENGNIYETITRNCTFETLGFICLSEIGTTLHVNNTQLTTYVSPVKIPMYSTEQSVNNNSHTNARKMSTEASTSKEKKTSVPSGSKLEHDVSTSAYTEDQEQITKFATIPGAPDIKSPMTYISSDLHSHVTKSSKENKVDSTSHEVLNENVNDNSPIGLLVGIIVTALVLVAVIVLLVVCRIK
ncbi:uncharacterized protein LOC143059403 [Mytilus galloprovincialis]|uniref:uncharacterized protein LOC143059403 n=1 Tax=Mytilus galloprovincialis TaxID=29158 RepID=UPI003F7B510D